MKNKTKKNYKLKNKSIKNRYRKINSTNQKKSHIIRIMLEMLNVIKLYHWKTRSYSQHKATDELYERLNKNIDRFVEVLLGKNESRINMVEKNIHLEDFSNSKDFKEKIYEYRDFLQKITKYFNSSNNTDLLSIRDDILADINQFLYLMTFR